MCVYFLYICVCVYMYVYVPYACKQQKKLYPPLFCQTASETSFLV